MSGMDGIDDSLEEATSEVLVAGHEVGGEQLPSSEDASWSAGCKFQALQLPLPPNLVVGAGTRVVP